MTLPTLQNDCNSSGAPSVSLLIDTGRRGKVPETAFATIVLRLNRLQPPAANPGEMWDPLGLYRPLPLEQRLFPLGFPLDLYTNSKEVVAAAQDLWGEYRPAFETEPMQLRVQVREGTPPSPFGTPAFHSQGHLFTTILDAHNLVIWDLDRGFGFARLTPEVARDHLYAGYFFLEPALTCVGQRFATPIHAACVARDGRGILLTGPSGMGKSSLAWALCRAGLTFVSDDASWLRRDSSAPVIFGKPHRLRFRPEALDLFPEIATLPRLETIKGPRSFEVRTADIPGLTTAPCCRPGRLLFLARQAQGEAALEPLSAAETMRRLSLTRNSYEPRVWREQEASLRKLADCPGHVLRYSRLEDAVRLIVNLP